MDHTIIKEGISLESFISSLYNLAHTVLQRTVAGGTFLSRMGKCRDRTQHFESATEKLRQKQTGNMCCNGMAVE
jgi:hypothetical protein